MLTFLDREAQSNYCSQTQSQIQFSFNYIAPNHENSHLEVLYIVILRPRIIYTPKQPGCCWRYATENDCFKHYLIIFR